METITKYSTALRYLERNITEFFIRNKATDEEIVAILQELADWCIDQADEVKAEWED